MKVKAIAITKPLIQVDEKDLSADELMAYVARVSSPKNQDNLNTMPKLLKYCYDNKHWSVFEQADLTVEITTSRTIAHQVLRHRSFTFQEFCMSGDTEVYFDLPGKLKVCKRQLYTLTLKQLFDKWNKKDAFGTPLKKRIKKMHIRSYDKFSNTFINSHIKEVFDTGLKDIFEITLENNKKIKCTKEHKVLTKEGFKSLEDAAGLELVGTTAIVRKKIEVGCNGIPMHQDYNWLREAKNRSIVSKLGVTGIATEAGVSYHTIRKWLKTLNLNFSRGTGNKLIPRFSKIKHVLYVGKEQTYDLEVDNFNHNYIANGIVVHNSQRYAKALKREEYGARRQDKKDRQNSIDDVSMEDKGWFIKAQQDVWKNCTDLYEQALNKGFAKESSRFLLPEVTQTTLFMKGNVRSWIHYVQVRTHEHAQKEHRDIAEEIKKIFIEQFPLVAEAMNWKNEDC